MTTPLLQRELWEPGTLIPASVQCNTSTVTHTFTNTHTCTHMRTGSRFKAVGSDFIGIVRAKAAVPQAQQLMQDDVAAEPEGEENTAHSKCC